MNQELVVTKANALVEASYRLNVSEQRVLALLVAQIHPNDEDFKPYRFKASKLQALVESANKDEHQRLKVLVKGLTEKSLNIPREDGGWLFVTWLSSGEYIPGRGEVELEFSPKLKPYLLKLQERFTSYKLGNVVKLRSRYSVRLYELLKQYESLGKRSFELVELRLVLGLADDEYSTWHDFKKRVLEPALRELPKKTDLGFSYTVRKRARAVAFVDFKIWPITHDKPPKKKSSKKSSKQTAEEASQSPNEKAQNCYRKHDSGSTCTVQNLATLNNLSEQQRAVCILCANHQYALFETGAA
jgi:plasmid replication initiation protein